MAENFERLTIYAYDNANYSGKEQRKFTVMFNPESFSNKIEIEYQDSQGQGTSASPQKFEKVKPRELSLEFTIDGTNAVAPISVSEEFSQSKAEGTDIDVNAKIEEFRETTMGYKGEIHRPYYLYIVYGDFYLYCVLKSADIKYTLFNRAGKPLRAKINCTFAENESDTKREKKERNSSPDLTHYRIVQEGDTLPLMAYRIYGDSAYYTQVARVNGLKHFRKLTPGTRLLFPPIDKTQPKA